MDASKELGRAQMERLDELIAKRERVARMYGERLAAVKGVEVPYVAPKVTRMSWFVYVVRLAPGVDRDAVMARLAEHGVSSRPYFSPIHLQPFYMDDFGCREGDFPVTEAVARSTLALPFYGNLGESEIEHVCRTLKAALNSK